ncbi:non-histone protein [Rhizopus microsporus]
MTNKKCICLDLKYKTKLIDLKKRIREVEKENDLLNVRLYKARKSIRHLKLERVFLLDRIEKSGNHIVDDNDEPLDLLSEMEDDSEVKYSKGSNNTRSKQDQEQKPKRDPNAPRGPGNVFFIYCRMERDKVKDECQTDNLGEITRILGQRWKNLSADEKKKYQDIFKKEYKEYTEALNAYAASLPTTTESTASSPAQPVDYSNTLPQSHESFEAFTEEQKKEAPYPQESSSTTTTMSWYPS